MVSGTPVFLELSGVATCIVTDSGIELDADVASCRSLCCNLFGIGACLVS